MECDFSYEHYSECLELADSCGYEFRLFIHNASASHPTIFLRHDLDVWPRYAVELAEIEARHGVQASYFFMYSSPTYSIFDNDTVDVMKYIQGMGHYIGLHVRRTEPVMSGINIPGVKIGKVISIHCPTTEQIGSRSFPISAYNKKFCGDIKYISDSRGSWREGCMCNHIQSKNSLQILTHPIYWGGNLSARVDDVLVQVSKNTAEYVNKIVHLYR